MPGLAHAHCPTAGTRTVALKSVADGDTFFTYDGAEVDLAGVLAPGSGGERITRTQANAARAVLAQAHSGDVLSLAFAGPEKDRYDRLKAQVFAGSEWVQEAVLRAGLALANPDLASDACANELLAAEGQAREAKSGHWGDGGFAVRTPDDLKKLISTFQIVEGTVQAVAMQKGRAYLDFDPDWKTEFTVTIAPEDMKVFRTAKFDVKGLAGKHVRVHGWLESYYGPEMEIARPASIELLDMALSPAPKNEKPGR